MYKDALNNLIKAKKFIYDFRKLKIIIEKAI
jgi:hypothetical protein